MTRDADLTALDQIAAVLVAVEAAALLAVFPFLLAPRFASMFGDLGGPLPLVTLEVADGVVYATGFEPRTV